MSKDKVDTESSALNNDELRHYFDKALSVAEKNNLLAEERNRLVERQYQQSVLNYEQAERQYLIEKSRMQPTFRLVISEFLMCEPDFMNDPEQASQAKYLNGFGVAIDERVLRIKVNVKGDAEYMRPSLVVSKTDSAGHTTDDRAYAMTDLIYFIEVGSLELSKSDSSAFAYLVYRDKTTLPVIHKYRLRQQEDVALRRWDAMHVDTVYATSLKSLSTLNTANGCARLFSDREEC